MLVLRCFRPVFLPFFICLLESPVFFFVFLFLHHYLPIHFFLCRPHSHTHTTIMQHVVRIIFILYIYIYLYSYSYIYIYREIKPTMCIIRLEFGGPSRLTLLVARTYRRSALCLSRDDDDDRGGSRRLSIPVTRLLR